MTVASRDVCGTGRRHDQTFGRVSGRRRNDFMARRVSGNSLGKAVSRTGETPLRQVFERLGT